MSKEILEQQIQHCADIISDTANSISDNRFGLSIDDIQCRVNECRHLLDRLETYLNTFKNREK